MIFDRIVFMETFPTGHYANQKLQLEGTLEPDESIEDAFIQAKQKVESSFKAANPNVGEVHTYFQSPASDHHNSIEEVYINQQFEEAKNGILAATTKKEAEEILLHSGFKLNLELKQIVNNKPE